MANEIANTNTNLYWSIKNVPLAPAKNSANNNGTKICRSNNNGSISPAPMSLMLEIMDQEQQYE